MKILFFGFGLFFLMVGVIGVITPLLPTTPFLLIAAACFARSSETFHTWLMTHPKLSPPIHDWQKRGVIRRPAKILATALIVINAVFPLFIIQTLQTPVRIIVAIVMIAVLTFIWSRPDS